MSSLLSFSLSLLSDGNANTHQDYNQSLHVKKSFS
jgi:hypothetical protein